MMDELLATLPSVEKGLIEAELEAEASAPRTGGTSFFSKGKGRVNGTIPFWEKTVPSSGTPNNSTGSAKVGPHFGASHIPSISERNDMPRFGGSVSRPPPTGTVNSSSTFVPLPTSTSTPTQAHPQQSPFSSRATHVFPLSSSQSSRPPAPLLGSSGIKYPTPLFSQPILPAGVSPAGVKVPSLFSLTGSANQTRNAFYTPPVTNGVKRLLGEDEPRPFVDVPPAPAPRTIDEPSVPAFNDDISMDSDSDSDDDYAAVGRTASIMSRANGTVETVPTELSYSVFGNSSEPKQPPLKSRRIIRSESSEMKMPPGAYLPDRDDHDVLTVATGATAKTQRHPSPTSSPPPPAKRTRSSASRLRAQRVVNEPNLRRSLPGAFMPEEEDNEEEDEVAPLPVPSKRPLRKTRSTMSVASSEDGDGEARPTRRSTRLSATSEVASGSPEPPSSQASTGKVRKSKKSTTTRSKSSSKKK